MESINSTIYCSMCSGCGRSGKKKDGFQVLDEIKGDERLQTIPVILFTTSEDAEDISRSYACGASTFITKPTRIDELREVLDDIGRYWSHAKLPDKKANIFLRSGR